MFTPQLKSSRLQVFPLSYAQMQLYIAPEQALEKSLGLLAGSRSISTRLQEALEQKILPAVADPANNYLFFTLWTIQDTAEQVLVGDLCFKGMPNAQGEVEIGYGTYPDFQNKGYMTEAVGLLADWALAQAGINAVVAETRPDNLASQKILTNNGFVAAPPNGEHLRWRRERS
ncbi:MAG: GNAT family N-acetyltransferase [Saprospiraceae bacterium]|nr:GNAT family N-acetyltransferase [Saprospiraceae bacterium]